MKCNITVLLLFTFSTTLSMAQVKKSQTDTSKFLKEAPVFPNDVKPVPQSMDAIFDSPEAMPSFPGGVLAFQDFLKKNLVNKTGNKIKAGASFIVEKDGSLTNVNVFKYDNEAIKQEIIRVINLLPKWKPGMQNNIPVRTRYVSLITF